MAKMLQAKLALHKFEKVLAKHSFKLDTILDKNFCGKAYKDYVYKREGIGGHVSVTIWATGEHGDAIHKYVQSNGIIAPSICETAPQLDRNLTRHYGTAE